MTPIANKPAANPQVFRAAYDETGVYFYQAFKENIAAPAIRHQSFENTDFRTNRMTWIKPNLGWMVHRAGYANKVGQTHVLQVKVSHDALASILERCVCKEKGGGTKGRVQWDPDRDLRALPEGKKTNFTPRKMLRQRAIQIGIKEELSQAYCQGILEINDVTPLVKKIEGAHQQMLIQSKNRYAKKDKTEVENPIDQLNLPVEKPYIPHCSKATLEHLGLISGETADRVARIGLGKADLASSD